VLAKGLDHTLCEARFCASIKIKRFHHPWWSLAITKAQAVVDILRRQLSGYKTNTQVRDVLLHRIAELSLDIELPGTHQARKELF
jgi:hypothetical protein